MTDVVWLSTMYSGSIQCINLQKPLPPSKRSGSKSRTVIWLFSDRSGSQHLWAGVANIALNTVPHRSGQVVICELLCTELTHDLIITFFFIKILPNQAGFPSSSHLSWSHLSFIFPPAGVRRRRKGQSPAVEAGYITLRCSVSHF